MSEAAGSVHGTQAAAPRKMQEMAESLQRLRLGGPFYALMWLLAGIASGLGLLIRDWRELSGPLADLLEATRPLWPLGQGVFSIVAGSGLLLLAATLIAHALKSRV